MKLLSLELSWLSKNMSLLQNYFSLRQDTIMRDMNQMKRDMDDRYVVIIPILSGIQEKLGCGTHPIHSFVVPHDDDEQVADNRTKTMVVKANIHTNDNAKGIEEDELEIDDQDTATANDSAKDTKVNENEKKDNDGGDSK
ncbi:hypothetical protein TorRG33x02_275810, partial [Trema orientale]